MDQQQSQKRGVRSEAQKLDRARDSYAPIPPANAVGGAFGEHEGSRQSDEELSSLLEERRAKKEKSDSE